MPWIEVILLSLANWMNRFYCPLECISTWTEFHFEIKNEIQFTHSTFQRMPSETNETLSEVLKDNSQNAAIQQQQQQQIKVKTLE